MLLKDVVRLRLGEKIKYMNCIKTLSYSTYISTLYLKLLNCKWQKNCKHFNSNMLYILHNSCGEWFGDSNVR